MGYPVHLPVLPPQLILRGLNVSNEEQTVHRIESIQYLEAPGST